MIRVISLSPVMRTAFDLTAPAWLSAAQVLGLDGPEVKGSRWDVPTL